MATIITSGTTVTVPTVLPTATPSGDTSFNPHRDALIKAALRLIGAYNSMDNPQPAQMVDALEALNIMLHSWQVEGFLWLKKFALLTLVPGQASYAIGALSPDTCIYTDTLRQAARPTRIKSACYRNSSGYDMPMIPLAREDYAALTNKGSSGRPNQYYYDPQTVQGIVTLWPVPIEASHLFLTVDRGIYDLVADTDNYDVPQEWLRAIKWGLAVELAPEYAVPPGELARLEARYLAIRQSVADFDAEAVSTMIQPGRR